MHLQMVHHNCGHDVGFKRLLNASGQTGVTLNDVATVPKHLETHATAAAEYLIVCYR
jgi:hypothetical protein